MMSLLLIWMVWAVNPNEPRHVDKVHEAASCLIAVFVKLLLKCTDSSRRYLLICASYHVYRTVVHYSIIIRT